MSEIERKWLVNPDAVPQGGEAVPLRQGYVALDGEVEVRVRDAGGACTLTFKRGAGLSRDEVELDLDPEHFEQLWGLSHGRRIAKTRRAVPVGELIAEVDVYADRHEGLAVVEVEFADEAAAHAFTPPDWFGREVTGDARYANRRLAVEERPPGA